MVHVYEFEIFPEDGWFVAVPFDFDGATEGRDFGDACEMAGDWLRVTVEDAAMHGKALPAPTFGNGPRHEGGRVIAFATDAGLDTVRKVTASEAARMLGVTPGRVTQMLDAGRLEGWREGHRTWVTVDSVEARLAESPKAGRPKKEPAAV